MRQSGETITSVSDGHIIRELNKSEEGEKDENVLGELNKKEKVEKDENKWEN